MGKFAWVTLATNDSYSMGALVLANSLRRVNTAHQLVVLITPGVTEAMKTQLSAVFNVVKLVDVLDSRDADNLALLARPELGITFTKLHCWKLTEYEKCVFLDADTLVLQNSDELFERDELSAAPDAGWPDCFNSGVFVYKPSHETFLALIEFALIHGSFDGGDQGLLNLFFSDWATKDIQKHLPFVYNMCSTATYSYIPAFKQFGAGLKIIHFIGTAKPWLQPFNTETGFVSVSGESQHLAQFVQLWWDIFCAHVHPTLSSEMTWHRLRSSYEFFSRPPPTMTFLSEQSYYFEQRPPTPPPPLFRESNHQEEQNYGYFDPWDEYLEQNDKQMSKESYMNYNNTVDNYLLTNDSSEINYGDHLSNFTSREFSNNEYIDDRINSIDKSHSDRRFDDRPSHSVHVNRTDTRNDHVHHTDTRNDHVHHSHEHSQPSSRDRPHSSEPRGGGGSSQPHVSSVSGGGNLQVHKTLSRRDSFSQLDRSQSVPEIRVNRPLVENSHLHEPQALPMTHEPSQCESSSVHCHSQQHSSSAQSDDEAGLAGALATVTLGAPVTVEQRALEEHLRRQGWEQGNIDYMGKDSFANIWQKICETLGTTTLAAPAVPPEDAPAPVAPVAAPVYVSSVEISPTGQIDKTPPQANYAPVSALKPTVEASDIKDATKAPLSETTTVAPEQKPSVTEVVPTEASVTPSSATLETSTPAPQITSEPPAAQQPVTPVESAVKPETTPEAPVSPTVPLTISSASKEALITVPPLIETLVLAPTVAETPTSSPPTLTQTEVPVPTTPASAPTPTPTETPVPTTPVPTEVPVPTTPASASTPTPTEAPVPTTPVPTDVPVPVTPPPTEAPVPTTPASTPTEVPVPTTPAPTPTEAPVPTTLASTPTEKPVPTTPAPAPTPTPTEVPVPTTPSPIPTEVPVPTTPAPAPTPTPTEVPVLTTPATIPTEGPVPTTPALTPTEASVPTPVPSEAPISTPTPTETPVSSPPTLTPASTPSAPTPTETVPPTLPVSPASVPIPTESSAPVPAEAPGNVPTPTSESIAPATKAEPAHPQTPTVTGPTPPTSPPVAAETPQLTKLQVEADVPETPPAGGSTQPSLEGAVADEPPVPPKRKGGSKAPQDSKNQKGGKPSKGKK